MRGVNYLWILVWLWIAIEIYWRLRDERKRDRAVRGQGYIGGNGPHYRRNPGNQERGK